MTPVASMASRWGAPPWTPSTRATSNHASALTTAPVSAVHPTMPPCDTIMSRVAALKAGMYDSVASETTRTSKPRSLASLAVDWTQTSVVTPVMIRCVQPAALSCISRMWRRRRLSRAYVL